MNFGTWKASTSNLPQHDHGEMHDQDDREQTAPISSRFTGHRAAPSWRPSLTDSALRANAKQSIHPLVDPWTASNASGPRI